MSNSTTSSSSSTNKGKHRCSRGTGQPPPFGFNTPYMYPPLPPHYWPPPPLPYHSNSSKTTSTTSNQQVYPDYPPDWRYPPFHPPYYPPSGFNQPYPFYPTMESTSRIDQGEAQTFGDSDRSDSPKQLSAIQVNTQPKGYAPSSPEDQGPAPAAVQEVPGVDHVADDEDLANQLLDFQAERDEDWPPIGKEPVRLMESPRIGKSFVAMESGIMYLNAVARHQGYSIAIKSHKGDNPEEKSRIYFRSEDAKNTRMLSKPESSYITLCSQEAHQKCTKSFRGAWGLPCSHELFQELKKSNHISKELIHHQWHLTMEFLPGNHDELKLSVQTKLDRLISLPEHSLRKINEELSKLESGRFALIPISDAVVKIHNRGRPRQKHRLKSQYEIEEARQAKRACPARCGYCKKPGHRQDNCTTRLTLLELDLDDFDLKEEDHSLKVTQVSSLDEETKLDLLDLPQAITVDPTIPHASQGTKHDKRVYKCTLCKEPGHRRDRCPNQADDALLGNGLSASTDSPFEGSTEPNRLIKSSGLNQSTSLIKTSSASTNSASLRNTLAPNTSKSSRWAQSSLSDQEDGRSEDSSVGSLWPDAEDGDLCPFCDDPLPPDPSTKLLRLKADLFALPNISKRVGHPDAMNLPFPQTAAFCALHHAERVTIPKGIQEGWPTAIDFKSLQSRIQNRYEYLFQIINQEISSSYLDVAKATWRSKGPRMFSMAGEFEGFEVEQPGYYGQIGFAVMIKELTRMFLSKAAPKLNASKAAPLPAEYYLRRVLVPELSLSLIAEDLGLPLLDSKVKNTLEASRAFGNSLYSLGEDGLSNENVDTISEPFDSSNPGDGDNSAITTPTNQKLLQQLPQKFNLVSDVYCVNQTHHANVGLYPRQLPYMRVPYCVGRCDV
ncbi:hypothetical protein DFH28DRAFT_932592 [Melampsora americana]|nr:hypothetical protein DFH28DRAFT_932592 [Melampsora americana]